MNQADIVKSNKQTLLNNQCGHCGTKENLEVVNMLDSSREPYSIVLCREHIKEFRGRVAAVSKKYAAHPTIRDGVKLVLEGLHDMYGLDLSQEDLRTTPQRVARMFAELCIGLSENPSEYLKVQSPTPEPPGLIVTSKIDFTSLCIHHFAVMSGYAYIGYIPQKSIVGLSKLARVVEAFARRPQLQEKMTNDIANCIDEVLQPSGVIVLIAAQHMCMNARGILKREAETSVVSVRGVFRSNDAECKDEFFHIINMQGAQHGS